MGHKVSVVYLTKELASLAPEEQGLRETESPYAVLSSDQILKLSVSPDKLIDLRSSDDYMRGYVKHSHWKNISELLGEDADADAPDSAVVIGNDVEHASQSADLLVQQGWQVAGIYCWDTGNIDQALPQSATIETPIDKSALFGGRHHCNMQDSRDYLAWEEELSDQIDQVVHQL